MGHCSQPLATNPLLGYYSQNAGCSSCQQRLSTDFRNACLCSMSCPGKCVLVSGVSCQKGPIRHAYAWQIGPFWQDTLGMSCMPYLLPVTWLCPQQSVTQHYSIEQGKRPQLWDCHLNSLRQSDASIIGSDNGLSPGRRQAITWTDVGILLIGPLGTNFSEMLIEIHTFSFKKIHLKMLSGKWRPFCLGLNVLNNDVHPTVWEYLIIPCQHIEVQTKWLPFGRWHLQIHLLKGKLQYFDSNFAGVCHLADDSCRYIFSNENYSTLIQISLEFVPGCPIKSDSALVQVIAWCWKGDKPLPGGMVNLFNGAYMYHQVPMS